jgi:hypothetical protein
MTDKQRNPFSTRSYETDRRSRRVVEPPYDNEELYDDEFEPDEHKVFGLGISQADDRQPAYGQGVVISLLSAAALLLLAIIAIGDGDGTTPPIFQRADTLFWVISAVVLVLTAGGAQYAERVAAQAAEEAGTGRPSKGLSTAWAVPLVSVFAAIMLTATFHNRWMLLFGPLIAFLGTAGALLSRDLLDEADEESSRVASTIHTLVVHTVAFLAFSAIYLNKFETWAAAPLVALVGGILILETLERAGIAAPSRMFYTVLGAWVLGTTMAALNWWPTWGWTGGAVLLAVFYAVAGVLLIWCERQDLRRRDMIEFVGVGSLAVMILALRDAFL